MRKFATVGELRQYLAEWPDDLRVVVGWESQYRMLTESEEGVDDGSVYGRVLVLGGEARPQRVSP